MLKGLYLVSGMQEMNLELSPHSVFWALLPSCCLPEEPLCIELTEEGFGMRSLSEAVANTSLHLCLCLGTGTAEWPLMQQNNDPFILISCLLHRLLRKS